MKPASTRSLVRHRSLSARVFAAAVTALLATHSARAADIVWDTSTTAGYQNADGIWGTDNFWTVNSGIGTGTTLQSWNVVDNAWFGGNASVAATPAGEFIITLNGTQQAATLRQIQGGAGNFTLTGGSLTLTNAGGIRADRGTFTINSPLATSLGINLASQSATTLIVLGGANTINGTITLSSMGAVKLTHASALGGSGALVAAGVTGGSLDINGFAISGRAFRAGNGISASLLSSSTSSDASWTGDIQLGSTTAYSGNVAAGATGAGRSLILSGNISGGAGGTGILSTITNSRLILTGGNTSSAGTTIASNSTLAVGNNTTTGSLGSGGVTLSAANASLVFNRSNAISVGNLIFGAGSMSANNSTGSVTLSAANTYSGGTTVAAGTLTIGIASTNTGTTINSGATGTGNVTLAGGVKLGQSAHLWLAPTMTLTGDIAMEGNSRQQVGFKTLDLGGGTRTISINPTGGTIKQTIAGNTALEGTGRSRWETLNTLGAMTVQNGNLILNSNLTGNDYAGFMFQTSTSFAGNAGLTVGSNVHLQTMSAGALGSTTSDTAKLTVNGIWNLAATASGGNQSVHSLAGTGKIYASMVATNTIGRTITLNGTSGSTDFSGELADGPGTGALSISKTGGSTQILSGTSSHTGTTTVSAGSLVVDGNISTSILTTVDSGATLGGSGTVGAMSVAGTLAPGNSIGTLTATGDVTWNSNEAWIFELGTAASTLALAASGGSTQDLLSIIGAGGDFLKGSGSTFTFDFANTGTMGTYKLVDWDGTTSFVNGDFAATNLLGGASGSFTIDSGTSALYLTVIPEPGIPVLLGSVGLLALRRRRRI